MAIWRFCVSPRQGEDDPSGRGALVTLRDFGIETAESVASSRLYLIEIDEGESTAHRIADELLCDPLIETCEITTEASSAPADGATLLEVYYKPGVMDTAAHSTELAMQDMGLAPKSVRTGRRFCIRPGVASKNLPRVQRLLANDCVQDVHVGERPIGPAPTPPSYPFELRTVELRSLDDGALMRLSRDGHLFLSLAEMKQMQVHFQKLEREPMDLELETLAQTWSEHCVHKTLKSAYVYRGAPMPTPGNDESTNATASTVELRFKNLLADTIARATQELIEEGRGPECLSVFVDNAGIIGFDETYGVAFKVETHNHPSAIEPYGGAATGVGGVIRDILGCGLGALPFANTDVFCVAPPDWPVGELPKGVIHPKSVLKGIVAGVRDYGNCMGIPTVNGAVYFDPRYLGNPLVYCGCVGLIPRDRIEKAPQPGDVVVVLGGRTGRDGIHGATFSSAELTDTHEDEFSHAVQIGNPVEEKKVRDLVLRARDYTGPTGDEAPRCLFSAITDCGAGGLSSAIGEMGEHTGVEVDLEKVPLKYAGLRYDEIWISEAQERMVLSVPPQDVDTLLALARAEEVEATAIGTFTDTGRLLVRYEGTVVGDLAMSFLHDGLPKIERVAEWQPVDSASDDASEHDEPVNFSHDSDVMAKRERGEPVQPALETDLSRRVEALMHDLNVSSKHWVIRQYDHEVRSGTVIKPLVGAGEGPSDAAVMRPRLDSRRGVVVGCGMVPELGDVDPYWMAIASIDEAVRNSVCVGGDPRNMAILDNFCWPSSEDPHALGALVRTCQACYDAAKVYGLPFVSGKDSLNNVFAMSADDAKRVQATVAARYGQHAEVVRQQFARQANKLGIPYTLLISAISVVENIDKCIHSAIALDDGTSTLVLYVGLDYLSWNNVRLAQLTDLHETVHALIHDGTVIAAHDVSDGGPLAALVEMAVGSGCELELLHESLAEDPAANQPHFGYMLALEPAVSATPDPIERLAQFTARYPQARADVMARMGGKGGDEKAAIRQTAHAVAEVTDDGAEMSVESARRAWRAPLDW